MTQVNTPYPATAYLTGFLRTREQDLGIEVVQADPALELFLRVFSKQGIADVIDELTAKANEFGPASMPESVRHFLDNAGRYHETVEPVVRFLQGRDPSLARRIACRELLPEGPRFLPLAAADANGGDDRRDDDGPSDSLDWAFGALGTTDRAKHLASLFIDDLGDVIRDGIDHRFELSRYGERLAASAPTFDPLAEALADEPSLIDEILIEITEELVSTHRPDVVGLTVPFPGNVYAAFRMAQTIKRIAPATTMLLGGGYVNTELRDLSEPRVFDFFDYLTLDDGERPLLALLDFLRKQDNGAGTGETKLVRTFRRVDGEVVYEHDPSAVDV